MIYEMKKIDLWSVIKISLLVHLVIGLLFGLLMSAFFSFIFVLSDQLDPYQSFGNSGFDPASFGVFGGILIGLFYSLMIVIINGFIVPLIIVLLYNLMAGWVGGFKVHLNEVTPAPAQTYTSTESTGGNA